MENKTQKLFAQFDDLPFFLLAVSNMLKLAVILNLLFPLIHPKVLVVKIYDVETNDLRFDPEPPPHTDFAKMARWLVHNSEWTAMGTISTLPVLAGFPMVNVIAMADSEKGAKSTGHIYFYLTMLDFTAQDLSKQNKLTALFTMDETLYCSNRKVDPMEPVCARIMISGEALRVAKDTEEFKFATSAMISHHPASVNWLDTHNFFLCKLNISSICVLDWYGGPHFVPIDEYYKTVLD